MQRTYTLVTGASEGIGRAFALYAAKRGRNLILSGRNEERLDAVADEIRANWGDVDVVVVSADLASPEGARRLWAAAEADGRKIDFLVNNAGLGRHGGFDEDGNEDGGWAREKASIDVNVMALTELMKLAMPQLKAAERGRVLNIASVAGLVAGPGMAVYHATKAYVVSLSRAVQAEMAGTNVTVTAFCPGATRTNFFEDAKMKGARITKIGKLPTAEEVAEEAYAAAIRGDTLAVPGAMNKLMAISAKVMPAFLAERVTQYLMAKA